MAFFQCNNITSVNISDLGAWCKMEFAGQTSNPLYYAHHLFLNGNEITDMEIPNNVRYIGEYAFGGCSGLTSVTIPSNVNYIERNAFEGCCGLTSVTISNGMTSIESQAFKDCSNLTSITIPSSVMSIDMLAFADCNSLESVIVEPGNSKYDSRENCNAIIETSTNTLIQGCKNTIIPKSVTSIGFDAFSGCSDLISFTIPNSVTSIGSSAFACTGLTTISIGSGVNKIYNYAFSYCSELTDVYCYARNVPSTETDAFYNTPVGNVTLHVPESSVNDYMATRPWRHFKDIVKIDIPKYTLTYIVDGEEYKSYEIEYGASIVPEPAPTKGGYTFSGWSEIPKTMPAHDVTVTGTFTKVSLGKCATPIISMIDGKMHFDCETLDVTYNYDITILDEPSGNGNDISLSNTYIIKVYATKDGYENSEVATKEIQFATGFDLNGDNKVNAADVVKLVNYILNHEK